jgi:hypothetical protein
MPRPWPLTTDQEQKLLTAYQDGLSRNACARQFGLARLSVNRLLERNGVSVRDLQTVCKSIVNEHAFDDPHNNEAAAYWIGFLMGDGCISTQRTSNYIILGLSVTDRDHVESFRQFIGCSNPLTSSKKGPMIALSVASSALAKALASYGVVPRKTHSSRVIGLEHNRHFWRGVTDADGWVGFANRRGTRHPAFSLVGSLSLMRQFASFARIFSDATASVNRCRDSWQFCPRGHYAVQVIHHLYSDCHVALPRKLASAQQVLAAWPLSPLARFACRYAVRDACNALRAQRL